MRRITIQMYNEARKKMEEGDDRPYRMLLSDVHDSLDQVLERMK